MPRLGLALNSFLVLICLCLPSPEVMGVYCVTVPRFKLHCLIYLIGGGTSVRSQDLVNAGQALY